MATSTETNSTAMARKTQNFSHAPLGRFLVRQMRLSETELDGLLDEMQGHSRRLGELLVEKDILTESEVEKALADQKIQLGEILVRRHVLSRSQLDSMLSEQKQTGERLGAMLFRKGMISYQRLQDALKEQYWRKNGYWVIS
ncbi:MAG: hypothetical protein AAFX40_01665 [Cyanobacteria bacterium J06639_1]